MSSKLLVVFLSSIVSPNSACMTNLRHCSKLWNKYMVQVVLGIFFCEIIAHILVDTGFTW